MSEEMIIKHCAPTLAGLKTGNIFSASYDSEAELNHDIARLNDRIHHKNLKAVILRARSGRALIYIYRPNQLADDLNRCKAREILDRFGYVRSDRTERHIQRLAHRIHSCSGFPHEIGLFLGYPPDDVKGFIESGGKGCKSCGCWKVYGDVDAAEELFRKYNKCTCVYQQCLQRGIPFERLVVRKGNIA